MCVKVPGSLMEHALDCQDNSKYFSNISLVVYRLVHAPVTRESGVRFPARERLLFSSLFQGYYPKTSWYLINEKSIIRFREARV